MGNIPINAINYKGDNFGCGFYRMIFPAMSLQTVMGSQYTFRITSTLSVFQDPRVYMADGGVRMVRLQRWYGADKAKFMREFLKPLSKKLGFWLVYEIDDVLVYDEIPKYNLARQHYNTTRIGTSVQDIMGDCDYITVTTPQLADLYAESYKLPRNKFIVIPNYLPRWWIGDSYNYDRQMSLYRDTIRKPRLAMACSMNHFDVSNQNGGVDDFSHIIPWIEYHIKKDDYKFIFVGGVPKQLEQYVKEKRVEYQPPSDILNYPFQMQLRKMDLLIAPLCINKFNECKSNIKWLEFSALGIPTMLQHIKTYTPYVDEDQMFHDANELENRVDSLFHKQDSAKRYSDVILKNKALIDKDPRYAPRGWWLETNIDKYVNLYAMPTKTMDVEIK